MKTFPQFKDVEMAGTSTYQITPKVQLFENYGQPYIVKHTDYWKEEKYILEQLKHAGIPRFYAMTANQGLILQFMPGYDLSKFTFSPKEIPMIFMQLCDIIAYVHARGIYHQDLKPENIVYDPKNKHLSIIDWEYARHTGQSDKFYCTPYYAAPEVLNCVYSGPANDIWSMGVILYNLYLGKLPFKGRDIKSLTQNVSQMNPDYTSLPSKVIHLLKRIFVHRSRRITAANISL